MTVVSELVTDAYRQSNLIGIGIAPTQPQEVEGLRYFNRILKSVLGNEVGDPLTGLPIGRGGIERPSGYPWWNTVPSGDWFVPKNTRLILNLETPDTNLYLHPSPDDGCRFGVVDASGSLFSFPVTIHGNGSLIEGQPSITLDTNNYNAEWFYRADKAEWVRYTPLAYFDECPFPEEFDDFFILSLAFRLNPAYNREIDGQSLMLLNKAKNKLTARYSQNVHTSSELALIRPPKTAYDRDEWGTYSEMFEPNAMFTRGWPW